MLGLLLWFTGSGLNAWIYYEKEIPLAENSGPSRGNLAQYGSIRWVHPRKKILSAQRKILGRIKEVSLKTV